MGGYGKPAEEVEGRGLKFQCLRGGSRYWSRPKSLSSGETTHLSGNGLPRSRKDAQLLAACRTCQTLVAAMTTSAMVATVARTTRYFFTSRPYADEGNFQPLTGWSGTGLVNASTTCP